MNFVSNHLFSLARSRSFCHGVSPLSARLEPWMIAQFNATHIHRLLEQHGSPINLLATEPMARNIARFAAVAENSGINFRIFFARKANKCLSFVDQAISCGGGLDTASENEVRQCLVRGTHPTDIICTAAIKSTSLIDLCIANQILIAVDNRDELDLIDKRSLHLGLRAKIAIRLGGFLHNGSKLLTRFGFDVDRDQRMLTELNGLSVDVVGIHFHLDRYDAAERVSAILESLRWIKQLRGLGHQPTFIDMGGGFPITYLDDESEWTQFWNQLHASLRDEKPAITYQGHGLGLHCINEVIHGHSSCYPSFQSLTSADWLATILDASVEGVSIARRLIDANLQLRCEPGRSVLDGCGMTAARVEFRKQNATGDWLIGLGMNRTQCRTTSIDFLLDPILVPTSDAGNNTPDVAMSGYLVGAYCTEAELLSLRKYVFPAGVRRGDVIVFPNTAGYLMHFMESRSHQFPLAKNLVFDAKADAWNLDLIDDPLWNP